MSQRKIIKAMAEGRVLKSRRELDGKKEFIIQNANGQTEVISQNVVNRLRKNRLIDSNKKFPVATFWLTDLGQEVAKKMRDAS